MSVTCRLPQFQTHFIPSLPSYLDSSPPPKYYNPPASTSTTFIDGFQGLNTNDRNRRTNTLSPSLTSTENRVSKAKKGKRVHACEYPGCTKIFTRAEHRRRHELSHKNKKAHTCTYIGCHKSFHRADYLAQHMARHGGDQVSTRKNHVSRSKTEPSPCSLSDSSTTHPASPSRLATHEFRPVESCNNTTINTIGQPIVPCSQCFKCQNNHQCPDPRTYFTSYTAGIHQMPLAAVAGVPGPLAAHDPSTVLPPQGADSVIEQYMRSMLRPEAFITPPQSLSLPGPPEEPMTSSYWTDNIDPRLPPLDPAIFNHDVSYPIWSPSNGDTSPRLQTQPTGPSLVEDTIQLA